MKTIPLLSVLSMLLAGCASPGPNRWPIQFDSRPQGARVEMDGKEFLGVTPCEAKIPGTAKRTFADKSGLAVASGGVTWTFTATLGTNKQARAYRAAGFLWEGETIPEKIFFDLQPAR